jgi:Tol biopolymer transport system component
VKRTLTLLTIAGMTLLGSVAIGGSAGAVVPGANGRILFARCIRPFKCGSDTVASWEIVAANPNDTNETVLAGPYPRDAWDDHFIANWSPDGSSAIFMVNQGIWQVNADASNLHLVWSPPSDRTGIDDGPTFTPDGRHIIFTRCCPRSTGYALWEIRADGTHLKPITSEAVPPGVDGPSDNLPQVSPNGRWVAYHRNPAPFNVQRIVVTNIDTGRRVRLTDPKLNAQVPNWSPDSKEVVFEIHPPDGSEDVAIVNADGTGYRQLTFGNGKTLNFAPSFSPDGTKIIFSRFRSTGGIDLFTMNPDGSGVTQVTRTAASDLWSQWAIAT